MAQFPNAVKAFTTKNPGDRIQSVDVDDLQDEVTAIEDGYLNGTARLNSSKSTVATLSVTGNSTLASSVTIGTQPYIFPASGGSTGQVLTITSTSGSTMTLGWATPGATVGGATLLKANSGTDASAGATTVDSVALSGLTAKDVLKVDVVMFSSSQATSTPTLYHVTDGVGLFGAGIVASLAAGETAGTQLTLQQAQSASTTVVIWNTGRGSVAGALNAVVSTAVTTPWTGSWSLGLRHSGVTAGGTFQWKWMVYKFAGQ